MVVRLMKVGKWHIAFLLTLFLVASFFAVFLWISNTYSPYSQPITYRVDLGSEKNFPVFIGPKPNDTDVALDTEILVDLWRGTNVSNFRSFPQIEIVKQSSKPADLGMTEIFYPAKPLKPSTTYNITLFIYDRDVSWGFTTKSEPFSPEIGYYLATYVLWVAFLAAVMVTLLVGAITRFVKKKKQI